MKTEKLDVKMINYDGFAASAPNQNIYSWPVCISESRLGIFSLFSSEGPTPVQEMLGITNKRYNKYNQHKNKQEHKKHTNWTLKLEKRPPKIENRLNQSLKQ